MRTLSKIAILISSSWMVIHAQPVAAQTFEERWSIIPKAKAEPAPQVGHQLKPEADTRAQSDAGAKPTDAPSGRSPKRAFSGKASYYSYGAKKTASGSVFNKNALTAAHRGLPFGTRVRVTDPATGRSVVVVITDRGPRIRGRVLDLSLGAARTLGITDRGVARVRAEVL
jgi:rare lipoprotein A (peptidoglycan hydrolase)